MRSCAAAAVVLWLGMAADAVIEKQLVAFRDIHAVGADIAARSVLRTHALKLPLHVAGDDQRHNKADGKRE